MKLKQHLHTFYGKLGPRGRGILSYLYATIPIRFRKKRGFWQYLEFLRSSQWHSAEWHNQYQQQQLRSIINFATQNSPFYRELAKVNQIEFGGSDDFASLRQFPILEKHTLVQRLSEFLPDNFPKRRLIKNSTSGSTGEPFKFHQDYYAVMREEAFVVRHLENAGTKIHEPSIYLRSYIPNAETDTYYFDRVNNRHYFSAYHLSKTILRECCKKIRNINASYIFGYPSALEILADYLSEAGETLKFAGAITGSEMLSSNARFKIESTLDTKIFDWYGLGEPTVTAGQCENGTYHTFSEYGFLELLDTKGNSVTKEGEVGRIVGTNFTNWALPLIRYDTNDLGVFTNRQCSCGRGLPVQVSSIRGRKDDLLVGSDGQFLPSVNFYSLFAKMGNEIRRFQLTQNEFNKFSLKIIRGPEFSEQSAKKITEGLTLRIGGRPQINIETVDKIKPTQAGKIRGVIRNYDFASKGEIEFNED